jgi:hypothetical protein
MVLATCGSLARNLAISKASFSRRIRAKLLHCGLAPGLLRHPMRPRGLTPQDVVCFKHLQGLSTACCCFNSSPATLLYLIQSFLNTLHSFHLINLSLYSFWFLPTCLCSFLFTVSSSLVRVCDIQVTARNPDSTMFERETLVKESNDTSAPPSYTDLDARNGLCPKASRWQTPARVVRFFTPQNRSAGKNRYQSTWHPSC